MRTIRVARLALALTAPIGAIASPIVSSGPTLSVPQEQLEAAFACTAPLAAGDRAVLLVHGTSVTPEENWSWTYQLALPAAGYPTCTVRLPDYAFIDIQVSSEYVVHAARRMRAATGRRIAMLGISQGGLEPRWAVRWWPDVAQATEDLIMLATPNHGGPFANLTCSAPCLPALWQQAENSAFLTALNEGDETPGDIDYTSLYSLTDWVIQPSAPVPTARLEGASNVLLQDVCPGRVVDHVQHAVDALVWHLVLDALTHEGPADPLRLAAEVCLQDTMPFVDPVVARQRMVEVYLLAAQRQGSYEHKVDAEPALKPYVFEVPLASGASAGGGAMSPLLLLALALALLPRRGAAALWRFKPLSEEKQP